MLLRRSFVLVLLAGLGLGGIGLSSSPAAAQDISAEAGQFVADLGDKAIAAISSKSMDATQRQQTFRQLFLQGFDVQAIGRFVLGRYWRTTTDAEKDEFMRLFEDMVVNTYATRFSDYAGETFKPGETFRILTKRSEGDNHAIVTTEIIRPTGGAPIHVDWRVLKPQGQLKIVDVLIEGVSMSVTQQQEFASVIQRSGGQVEGLLTLLRERAKRPS
jgi:phospholipid transport system substrate-binding protein